MQRHKLHLLGMKDLEFLESLTTQVRRDILRMVHRVNSGHPGGSLGCAELFVVLYFNQMEYSLPFSMDGKMKTYSFYPTDIFHQFSIVYWLEKGFPVNELNSFRHINSRLQGHPTTHEGLPELELRQVH